MTGSRKFLFGVVGVLLVAAAIVAAGQYRLDAQRQAEEAGILLDRGIEQLSQGQFEAALATLRSFPRDEISDWRIPYHEGRALIQLKDYEAAAVALEQAFGMNDREERIPFALGVVYFKLGNLGLSKSYFHAVLEINPANEEAKGLMDTMAGLERRPPGEPQAGPTAEDSGMPKVHGRRRAAPAPAPDDPDGGS
jgi:tetratricopeptide (TPR) repeat protein